MCYCSRWSRRLQVYWFQCLVVYSGTYEPLETVVPLLSAGSQTSHKLRHHINLQFRSLQQLIWDTHWINGWLLDPWSPLVDGTWIYKSLCFAFPLQLLVVRPLIFFLIQIEVYHSHLLTWNMEYNQRKYLETWFNGNVINAWFRQKSILAGNLFILDWPLYPPFSPASSFSVFSIPPLPTFGKLHIRRLPHHHNLSKTC